MSSMAISFLTILLGTAFYTFGELKNKWGKYAMGVPIGIVYAVTIQSWLPLTCWLTYFLASWALPYGEKSPITKLVGNRLAITIHGVGIGLASFPIVAYFAILGGIIGGVSFYILSVLDDKEVVKEPWLAILRPLIGLSVLLIK